LITSVHSSEAGRMSIDRFATPTRLATTVSSRRLGLLIACLVCALLLAGCGQNASQDDEQATVKDVLGVDLNNPEAALDEMEGQVNQRIAACMKQQGFEWQPDPTIETIQTTADDGLTYGTKEWVQKYGFGTSTRYFPQSQLSGGLVGFSHEPNLSNWESPNEVYFESLDPLEREAYTAALQGTSGCSSEAIAAVRSESALGIISAAFGSELMEVRERVSADPRLLDYDAKVSRCLRENGVGFDSQDEFDVYIYERLSEVEDSDNNSNGSSLTPDGVPDRSTEQVRTVLSSGALDELTKIQAEEVAVALQFFECGQGPERQDLVDEVWSEYESDFVNENRDELASLRERIDG